MSDTELTRAEQLSLRVHRAKTVADLVDIMHEFHAEMTCRAATMIVQMAYQIGRCDVAEELHRECQP